MKIRCDVCERAEAALLCCADEAALCWVCDANVHAANKLARKHQRVPLLTPISSSAPNAQMPTCDVCQEKAGYFFCLEDRALLCRNCDAGIHTSSPHGTSHRRFLITGVRVALQHYLANSTTSNSNNNDASNNSISDGDNGSNYIITPASSNLSTPNKNTEGEGEQWMWRGDVLDSAEFDHCYGNSKPGSSSQQSKKDERTRHGGIS